MIKNLGILLLYTIVAQAMSWFQIYGSQKIIIPYVNKYIGYLIAIPISYLFIEGSRAGVIYFNGTAWPVRIIGFSLGNFIFFILSYYFLQESLTPKTWVCLFLCLIVLMIQVCWK